MMYQYFKNRNIYLAIPVFLLIGSCLFYALDTISHQTIVKPLTAGFLTWRLPILLVFSSILLTLISRNLKSSERRKIYLLDGLLWLSAPLSLLLATSVSSIHYPELLTGVFFLGLWAGKSALLFWTLYVRQKHTPATGILVFIVMLWFFGVHGSWHAPAHRIHGDEPHYLLMAHSLVNDGDLNLHNQYINKDYSAFYSGVLEPKPSDYIAPNEIYSRGLGAVFPVFLAPFYAIGGFRAVQTFMIFCAALLITQLYLLVLSSGLQAKHAFLSAALVASCSPVLNYSSLIYPDIMAALLIVLGLRALQIPHISKAGRSVPTYVFLISTILIFTKFRYFVPVLLLMIPVFIREIKRLRSSIALVLSISLFGALYAVADRWLLSGDLFSNRFGDIDRIIRYLPSLQSIRVIPGLLLDQESGLLIHAPLYFLAIAGIRLYNGNRNSTYWFAVWGVPFTMLSLLGHFAWHSLPTPPLRYLLPVLPPTAIFIAAAIENWRQRSRLFRLVAGISISVSWIHVWMLSLKPEWQINLADGTAKILSELSQIVRYPLPALFPSVIRVNSALVPWLFILTMMLLIYTYPPWRDKQGQKITRVTVISVLAAFVIVFWVVFQTFSVQSYQLEDRYWIQPEGGTFYPENRDPFHHRELSYGWSFAPGTTVTIPAYKPKNSFIAVARCKLQDSWLPQNLEITSQDSSPFQITVTSKKWMDYAFRITSNDSISEIVFNAPDTNTGSVVIDNVKIIRPSYRQFHLWLNIGSILERAGLYQWALYCNKRALLVTPGAPWYELNNFFHPTGAVQQPEIAKQYPFPDSFFHRLLNNALNAGWTYTHHLENLFNFSARYKIPESELLDYAITGVLNGHQPSVTQLIRLPLNDHDDTDLQMLLAIAFYLRGQMPESAKQLDKLLIQGDQFPMRLGEPASHLPVSHPCYSLLSDMQNNDAFRHHAYLRTNSYLVKSVQAFHQENYWAGSEYFDKYYLSDYEIFMETIPDIDQAFASMMFQRASRIHKVHVLKLINKTLDNRHVDTAVAAAEYGLRMNPDDPILRQQKARTLYNKRDLQQSRSLCLENIRLDYTDDYSRWLLQRIKKQTRHSSHALSSPNTNQNTQG